MLPLNTCHIRHLFTLLRRLWRLKVLIIEIVRTARLSVRIVLVRTPAVGQEGGVTFNCCQHTEARAGSADSAVGHRPHPHPHASGFSRPSEVRAAHSAHCTLDTGHCRRDRTLRVCLTVLSLRSHRAFHRYTQIAIYYAHHGALAVEHTSQTSIAS